MIALITPTGLRPRQIQLCFEYMKAQTYKGTVLWVIVDDGQDSSVDFIDEHFREGWIVVKVRPMPYWSKGQNTQSRNIQAGLNVVKGNKEVDAIFIIEDDDYYSPDYLDVMCPLLKGYDIVGEKRSIYYHVLLQEGLRMANAEHSSLFQTAFTPAVIPTLETILKKHPTFIDIQLWKAVERKRLFSGVDLAIGMKGLPGRHGIGNGHELRIYRNRKTMPLKEIEEIMKDAILNYL